jgi:hypothetical protein
MASVYDLIFGTLAQGNAGQAFALRDQRRRDAANEERRSRADRIDEALAQARLDALTFDLNQRKQGGRLADTLFPEVGPPADDSTARNAIGRTLLQGGDLGGAAKLFDGGGGQPDSPFGKLNPADYTPESLAAFARSGFRDYPALVPREGGGPEYRQVQGVDASGNPITQLIDTNTLPPGSGTVDNPVGITFRRGAPKPLPEAAQGDLSGALDALRALDTIEGGIGESGVVEGRVSKGQAALGFNERAIDFETARNNLKLAAQSLIKGIPSNFDVQTVINTLPDLTLPESVNRSRLEFTRQVTADLIRGKIAFYKGTGYNIPPLLVQRASALGVNVDDVAPVDVNESGQPTTDPFIYAQLRTAQEGEVVTIGGRNYRVVTPDPGGNPDLELVR